LPRIHARVNIEKVEQNQPTKNILIREIFLFYRFATFFDV